MAKQQEKAPAQKGKKKRFSSTLLWGLLGLVILTAGVVSALYYMNRERIETDTRLRVIKDFVAKVDETIERGRSTLETTIDKGREVAGVGSGAKDPGMAPRTGAGLFSSARSHIVQPGENLYAIARESGLVDSEWEWRTILAQNRDKIEWAFINDDEQDWKVMLAEGQELIVEPNHRPVGTPQEGRYAFQLASMSERQLPRAEFVVRRLLGDGYYAYLYAHDQDGERWYRIRSGFYDSEAKAKAVGEDIRARYTEQNYFPDKLWVLRPSAAEQRGEGLVFGTQLINPWVVELADRDTHAEAVRDFRRANRAGQFAYIWQGHNPLNQRFVYRVRVGFFPNEDAAKEMLSGQQGELWQNARTLKVDKMEETLPGQPMILGEVES